MGQASIMIRPTQTPRPWAVEKVHRAEEISCVLESRLVKSSDARMPAPPDPNEMKPRRKWLEETWVHINSFSLYDAVL